MAATRPMRAGSLVQDKLVPFELDAAPSSCSGCQVADGWMHHACVLDVLLHLLIEIIESVAALLLHTSVIVPACTSTVLDSILTN